MAQFCLEEALIAMIRLQDARSEDRVEAEMTAATMAASAPDPVLAGQLERQRIFAEAAE